MRLLTVNTGSSSVRLGLHDYDNLSDESAPTPWCTARHAAHADKRLSQPH